MQNTKNFEIIEIRHI